MTARAVTHAPLASYAVRQSFVFCTLNPQGLSSLISTRSPLGLGSLNVGGDGSTLLYGFVLPDAEKVSLYPAPEGSLLLQGHVYVYTVVRTS